jgi:RHS repeat-associated protein
VDEVFARVSAGGVAAWYLTDRLGSVRELVDGYGSLQDEVAYDGFGKLLSETNPGFGDRWKYTGREWESETGLYYYRARQYDAVTGRFTSEDPIGFGGGDANLARYVGNGPTNATDPSGLDEHPDWKIPVQLMLIPRCSSCHLSGVLDGRRSVLDLSPGQRIAIMRAVGARNEIEAELIMSQWRGLDPAMANVVRGVGRGFKRSWEDLNESVGEYYRTAPDNPDAKFWYDLYLIGKGTANLPGAVKKGLEAFHDDPAEGTGYGLGLASQAIITKKVGELATATEVSAAAKTVAPRSNIPALTEQGLLPPGVHRTTLPELKARFGGNYVRDEVLGNLEKLLTDAKAAGLPVKKVYVAGSATTSKPYPGDFDAILVLDKPRSSITSPAQRQFLDEAFVKRTYKGDVFAIVEGDSALTEKVNFFSKTREGTARGIIEIPGN